MAAATVPPTASPTKSPTVTSPPTTVTTEGDTTQDEDQIDTTTTETATESIRIDDFTLRIVVPSTASRRLGQGVPYNQMELTTITNKHMATYFENELNRKVPSVNLRIQQSQVTSLQGSTVVEERMSGTVDFYSNEPLPSAVTVNALVIQALEGQAMWEYFFRLRGANDVYLANTQQVTLVDASSSTTSASSRTSAASSTISTGVITTLVVVGLVTAAIVGYFVYWWKKQTTKEDNETMKKNADTPDTQSSDPFFPDSAEQETKSSGSKQGSLRHNDEGMSVGSVSLVSSTLHSIRERSLEDEEEESDEAELEPPSGDRLWGDDTASEIEVQTELLENTPPFNYNDDDTVMQDCGQIHRIMPLETNYSTIYGTEVTRREVELNKKQPTEKPANRWITWKKSTPGAQKKKAVAKQKSAGDQNRLPPLELDTSLDPPSMTDMSLDPPSQTSMSAIDYSLDPPSQVDIDVPSFQSDGSVSLKGESINLSEF